MSILFITHDLTIVRQISDRVCVMYDGEIKETGDTKEIFNNPQDDYTKHLLSSEPEERDLFYDKNGKNIITGKDLNITFNTKVKVAGRNKTLSIKAVNNVSLNLKEGETLGIVGESGSGKTTLGQTLLRLVDRESNTEISGDINFFDDKIDQLILTTGTFLNGLIHIGEVKIPAGRYDEKPSTGLSEQLEKFDMKIGRLKTGTPPRLD